VIINSSDWTLVTTLTPSGDTTIDTATLPAHDLWKIVIEIETDLDAGAGEHAVQLRLNNDNGAGYNYRNIDNTAIIQNNGQTEFELMTLWRHATLIRKGVGEFILNGRKHGVDTDAIAIAGYAAPADACYNMMLNGIYHRGSLDITVFNFLFAVASSGNIFIYAKDF